MEARLQRRVQRYGWDRAADRYDDCWREPLTAARLRLVEMAALRPGERVLDVACGTGAATFDAAREVGPDGRVFGTDVSDRMVELARSAAADAGIANVDFERMDAERLEVPAQSFDAALCALGLMYMPQPEDALAAMAGALRSGGRVAVSTWGERRRCGWAQLFPIVDARVASEVCPLFFRLGGGDALKLALEGAGFSGVRVERIDAVLRHRSLDDACNAALVAGPVALAWSRFGQDERSAVRDEYAESIRPFRTSDDGYAIPGEFVVATGRKA
jgi:ubiquinone/menaquinone biosynthesis C-methylase UbiE